MQGLASGSAPRNAVFNRCDKLFHILGHRTIKGKGLPGNGVGKAQMRGMQGLAFKVP